MSAFPAAAPEPVHRLIAALGGEARLERESGEGPFGVWLLELSRVALEIRREYHSWSLFLRSSVSGVSPVAFWRVAVSGGAEPADPDLEADVDFVIANAPTVSDPTVDLENRVTSLRTAYEIAMRRRLGFDE